MLLARREKSLLGLGETSDAAAAFGYLLAAAKLGLDVYKAIDSATLAREANKLQKMGLEVERQIALEKLSLMKLQEELAAAKDANLTSSVSTGAYLAIGGVVLALLFMGGHRAAR